MSMELLLSDEYSGNSEEHQTHSPCPRTAYNLAKKEEALEAMISSGIMEAWVLQGGRSGCRWKEGSDGKTHAGRGRKQ